MKLTINVVHLVGYNATQRFDSATVHDEKSPDGIWGFLILNKGHTLHFVVIVFKETNYGNND